MTPYDSPDFDEHEHVSFFRDAEVGLEVILAIHSTAPIGVSGGGCRRWHYATSSLALRDALRLSRAMSFKLALMGLPAGGAKAVILAAEGEPKTEASLRALGRAVHRLGGRFIAGEDVGTTPADMAIVRTVTPFVVAERPGDDTAAATAQGVAIAIRRALAQRHETVEGKRVLIQGVGRVGFALAELLARDGARLVVSDVDKPAVARAHASFGAEVLEPERCLDAEVDVYAPCALGDAIDAADVTRLRCSIVAGSANNPLVDERAAEALHARGILYCPDFIANAGGTIGAARSGAESAGPFATLLPNFDRIADLLGRVFDASHRSGRSTNAVAVEMARDAVRAMRGQRAASPSNGGARATSGG